MTPAPHNTPRSDPLALLRAGVGSAAVDALALEGIPNGVSLERPKKAAHGDFATNAAMVCAPLARDNPRNVASGIAAKLAETLGDQLTSAEVAGPGFLNLRLADAWYGGALTAVLADREFGGNVAEQPERINLEFPSANPTGPMHIGHGRNAAYGDAQRMLARDAVNGFLFILPKITVSAAKLDGLWEDWPLPVNPLAELKWLP